MKDTYLTIKNTAEGIYKEKGSKFLAHAIPVRSEEEIRTKLEEIKKDHPTSRHICYAYVIGITGETYRVNDAGEPSGTAGLPILGQIRSKELSDVLLVVVRYFGGTKLGASGLKNAYKTAARDALDQVKIIKRTLQSTFELHFEYDDMKNVMAALKLLNADIKEQNFGQTCHLTFNIRQKENEKVHTMFAKMGNLGLKKINA